MNVTAESSFAPLEYYKKLTNCLANRKNIKLNISKIQGNREYRFKATPFITNRKIQLKFLANYRMRKQFNENQKQQREKLANKNINNNNNVALNEKLKRKTNEESYINLPDSYFKAEQLPDLSLFKVPGIPPIKRQRIEILPNTVNVSNNFTLASLFSGNFNPPKCSTPIEQVKADQPKPIMSDPNDILGSLEKLKFLERETTRDKDINDRLMAARELDRMKAYKNLIDDAALYVDSVCFGELTDAIIAIIKRLYGKHEEASQSPRTSLISPQRIRSLFNVFSQTPIDAENIPSWPVPVFYDQPNEMTVNDIAYNNKNDDDDINPLFENTNDLFSFLDEEDPIDLGTSAIEYDVTPSTSQASFFNTKAAPHPSSNTFLASTRFSLTPYPRSPNYGNCDDLDWLESKFAESMDMSWETGSTFTFVANRNNSDLSAIFRSPPNTNNLESRKAFSRTIERPKTYNRSESDGFSDKDDDFSWWFCDNDKSPNNMFMHNDTQNIFNTNFSLF